MAPPRQVIPLEKKKLNWRKDMALTEEDKTWISDQLEHVETKLLTKFHKRASPTDQKLRSHPLAIRARDLQIDQIARRVKKLEAAEDRPPK